MNSETSSDDQTSSEDQYEVLMAELESVYAQMREAGAPLNAHEVGTIKRGMTSDNLDRSVGSLRSIFRVIETLETIKTSQ